ncbi:MAG: response regulator [Desulfobacteraceae bacterium]|uniref:Response regulator n=1 Tax=Candidatus Desulfaltia bathyphila TaxID=2841697 RepID=A0A8J6TBI5_9BACT|nr:response regulator [Candidatus Desulfaltia bathyphila]MBL7195132.1 response regulator [Desulfobacterales bacterium]
MKEKLDILLLDDEAIVGNRLKPALKKVGCDVELFEDPKKALNRIREKKFDIVITDIMMPSVNGIQILEEVRKKSDITKVIIITGYATVALAREAMDKGAFDMIAKPFTPDNLRSVIAKAADSLGYKKIIAKA